MQRTRKARSGRTWLVIALPYGWLLLFFLTPLALVLKIALSQSALSMPPYAPVFDWSDNVGAIVEKLQTLSFDSFTGLFSDSLYVVSYISSVIIAAIATILAFCSKGRRALRAMPFAELSTILPSAAATRSTACGSSPV